MAQHAPGVDKVPEPPFGGRQIGNIPASDGGDWEPAGMKDAEGAYVGTVVGGAEYCPLARSQRSVQVLAAADLNQPRQGPGPAPQPHYVDDFAGEEPEQVPGQPLSLFRG